MFVKYFFDEFLEIFIFCRKFNSFIFLYFLSLFSCFRSDPCTYILSVFNSFSSFTSRDFRSLQFYGIWFVNWDFQVSDAFGAFWLKNRNNLFCQAFMIIRKNYGFRTSYLCTFIFDLYYRLITIYQRCYFEGLIPFNYAWVLRQSRLRRIYLSSIAVSKCNKYLIWKLRKEYTFNNFYFYIFILLFFSFGISQIVVWRQVVEGLEHGYWC